MSDPDIHHLLQQAKSLLGTTSTTPRLDAEILLAYVLGKPRAYLYTWPEHIPPNPLQQAFFSLLTRRQSGEPMAYLTGHRAFWSLDLQVSADTLIPRPESELLIRLALPRLASCSQQCIADLGTGSGALALALAQERPDIVIIATDNSAAALRIAKHNAKVLELTNVIFVQVDWCSGLAMNQFDLMVSNPPYIAADSPWLQHGDVRFEPLSALVAGHDGLDAIRRIVAQAIAVLKPGAWLLIEHGFDQGQAVSALLRDRGFTEVSSHRDYQGIDRVGVGRRPL